MKQIFYAIAAIVVLFFAIRLMAKVKDVTDDGAPSDFDDAPEP